MTKVDAQRKEVKMLEMLYITKRERFISSGSDVMRNNPVFDFFGPVGGFRF